MPKARRDPRQIHIYGFGRTKKRSPVYRRFCGCFPPQPCNHLRPTRDDIMLARNKSSATTESDTHANTRGKKNAWVRLPYLGRLSATEGPSLPKNKTRHGKKCKRKSKNKTHTQTYTHLYLSRHPFLSPCSQAYLKQNTTLRREAARKTTVLHARTHTQTHTDT